MFGPSQPNQVALLGLLWEAQELCSRLYWDEYNDPANFGCPGGRVFVRTLWDGPDFPSAAANPNPITGYDAGTGLDWSAPVADSHLDRLDSDQVDSRIGFCECPTGTPNWNGAACTL
jgi:hypothetical protein